ncbi:16S rRNA (cytosine(1402)-N(4))-methyltransferase RsmH [Pelagibacteraceae bacterium]|nr:16S rRNA (cytosine(1402)-N(4))-methyltransferase RsmH [Pelagibacteraceae bacterium]
MNFHHTSLESLHFPVMLKEVLKVCEPENGGSFLDCTFGGGGYSKAILRYPNTNVLALDRDKFALKESKEVKKKYSNRFYFYNEKFSNLSKVLKNKKIDNIIFDLGISSFQLADMSRGFSFKAKESIDMNMGLSSLSAEDVINTYEEESLKLIIKILGEEIEASKIVKNIIKARKEKRISKVSQLVDIIEKSKKKNFKKKINVCTKTFQALRIFVNKEISELIEGIISATRTIKPGGKIIIVTFHSIEDKIVKFYFNQYSKNKSKPSRYIPENTEDDIIFFEDRNNFIKPSEEEIIINPRSRSAKLRYAIRNDKKFTETQDLKNKFKKYIELESLNG